MTCMLFLVGLGLDVKDLSLKAIEAIKSSDLVYYESYTAPLDQEYLLYIEKATKKKPKKLSRSDLEENSKRLIYHAKKSTVSILIPGDPLVATTHHTVLDSARNEGVKTGVIHAPSIFSALIGESRLDIYKFGPTTTIPFWSKRYKPASFIDVIKNNLKNGEHTILLLDFDSAKNSSMRLEEAIRTIIYAGKQKGDASLGEIKAIAFGNLGRKNTTVRYGNLRELERLAKEFCEKTTSLIIPAKLNFAEEAALASLIGKDPKNKNI